MKKWISLLLICLLLAGCATEQEEATLPSETVPQTEPTILETGPEVSELEEPDIPLTIFLPDENANGFCMMSVMVSTSDAESILDNLIKHSMLREGIELNSAELTNRQLNLDFNQAFYDQLCTYGTTGEYLMIGCVVNTYLGVYDADTVYITVNGEVMESGHMIYDFPMGYFE